jgi:hypothetical protein
MRLLDRGARSGRSRRRADEEYYKYFEEPTGSNPSADSKKLAEHFAVQRERARRAVPRYGPMT